MSALHELLSTLTMLITLTKTTHEPPSLAPVSDLLVSDAVYSL